MHSDLDQNRREDVMLDFKSGKINVVVATDIISRGIDIDDIEMVINFDVPREAEDYVHRIGRTARADRDGRAVTFVSKEDFQRLARIERLLEKEVPREQVPEELGEAPSYSGSSRSVGNRSGRGRNGRNRKAVKNTGAFRPRPHDKSVVRTPENQPAPTDEQYNHSSKDSSAAEDKKNGNGKHHFHRHKNRRGKPQGSNANSSASPTDSTK